MVDSMQMIGEQQHCKLSELKRCGGQESGEQKLQTKFLVNAKIN
jgi:hypothetical protein